MNLIKARRSRRSFALVEAAALGIPKMNAAERTFATAELMEAVLLQFLDQVQDIDDQEDPRSSRTYHNERVLQELLKLSLVSRTWHQAFRDSGRLRRALYLDPDHLTTRSWTIPPTTSQIARCSYYRSPPRRAAPLLNPIIQVLFPTYHFRFWHLSPEYSDNKFCAYLIITKRDLPALKQQELTGQGRTISTMLLSQPPCVELEAMIWEERDETKDYTGRTCELEDPVIRQDGGLRLGFVHERVEGMFAKYPDLKAIKLTTT